MADAVEAAYAVRPQSYAAMSISAMMHGYLAFDDAGDLVVPFHTWRNTSTAAAAAQPTSLNRRQAAEVVSGAAASMARLIDDLLAVARQRSGAYTESALDLGTLARGAVEEYRALADQRSIRLVPRIEDPGPRVYGHGQALTRALRNLLANAVRFSPDAGEVLVAVGSRRGWAWAAVRDQGPGVPDEDRDRVFDRFYSATNGSPPEREPGPEPGTGIGLAIARQIVEAHDGRLALFSATGRGSTFVIWLPDRTDVAPRDRAADVPEEDPLGR